LAPFTELVYAPATIFGVLPLLASASAYLRSPSFVTLPSSTLMRRFEPSEPMTRRRSATGLKSTVMVALPGSGMSSFDFCVALPDAVSMVQIVPSEDTP